MRERKRLLRRTEVQKITGLGRSTIYALMAAGRFPKPVKITGKSVAWPDDQINAWVAACIVGNTPDTVLPPAA